MGVPAPVTDGHVVTGPGYLPGLARDHLPDSLAGMLRAPLLVENDANLAVVGERWHGVAAGVDDVVVLLAGERLGADLVLGGRLVRGAAGGAGELGFARLVEGVDNTDAIGGMARELGAVAVADALAAGPASEPVPGGLVELSHGDPERVTAQHVMTAARHADPLAADVLDVVTERVARVIAVLGTLLDPRLVVIGGGVAGGGDVLLPRLVEHLGHLVERPPRIDVSSLGDHAVIAGAVRTALDHALDTLMENPTAARGGDTSAM
jgi:predicted NBD/HSP70 family sugar kinase